MKNRTPSSHQLYPEKFYLVILIVLAVASCKSKRETTSPILEIISESVYASGVVKSKNQYQVYSTTNGLIGEILVKEGELRGVDFQNVPLDVSVCANTIPH